ncbi:Hypothetical predicted protein [Paramuricea clavata]|uniref:Uncharacterized protein n=1 Tax=Paramuricea clavata TaxID=317549 RepID=A0A6S7KDF7_PARCT|nr:Hypothetical predicted protein [Paramuricea clavata]
MPHFKVGEYMKKCKEVRNAGFMTKRNLRDAQAEVSQLEMELQRKDKLLRGLQERKRRMDAKISNLEDEVDSLPEKSRFTQCSILSDRAVESRKKHPTRFQNKKFSSSLSVQRQRRKETFAAAQKIHGGSEETEVPGAIGIVDTALVKCSQSILVDVMSVNQKFNQSVMPSIYKPKLGEFEASTENMIRSVSVYYSGGVAGKKKYRKIYKDSSYKIAMQSKGKKRVRLSVNNCPIPRLVPYNKLMPFIKSIPVGSIYSVYETLCEGLDEEYKVHGCYRNLAELFIKLAEFYLSGCSGHTLVWFEEEYKFYVSLGGDGAPFGKHDTACAWLVGFLNIGRGILSSNENFLLFGANCSENCIPVQRYIKMLVSDVQHLEQQTFKCTYITSESQTCTVDIKFHISEFPNDLKMVAFLCGELTNSATYFCSFANVSSKDATDLNGQFGKEKDKKWHPWNYSERVQVAKSVETFKQTVAKQNIAESTKRSKVTNFIAGKRSRQEFKPLLGPVVDRIHIDPLHLKNNACALAHRLLLQEVLLISQLPSAIKSFLQVPSTSPFHKYIDAMRTKCNLRRLANQIIRWFNENRDSKFDYRFTGKDSRCFLQNFMFLIAAMEPFLKDKTLRHCLHFMYLLTCV